SHAPAHCRARALSGSMLVRVRQEREIARALDRRRQLALIRRARSRDPARDDLAGLGDVSLQRREILVVDLLDAFSRESTKLLASKIASHVRCPLNLLALFGDFFAERRFRAVEIGRGPRRTLARRPIALSGLSLALLFLFARLRHERRLRDRLVAADHEIAQHGVAESERADELIEGRLVALDVEQQVVRFVDLGDRMRELTAAPVFLAMYLAAGTL